MLKISNTSFRDISGICTLHYEGVRKSISTAIEHSKFPSEIKKYLGSNTEKIITSQPDDLISLEWEIPIVIASYLKWDLKKVNKILENIFNYNNFLNRSLTTKWNTYTLADHLKVNTCVYCNGNYTFTVSSTFKKITRPQFDHFFSQEEYPLLRLSFYNLIPCCSSCNGPTLKGRTKLNLIEYLHPYLEGYGTDANFTYIPHDYEAAVGKNNNLTIKILEKNLASRNKIARQKALFKIEEIYNSHLDHVQEIIFKTHSTKGNYINILRHFFGGKISEKDIYRLALGNYCEEDELDKRVLAKLTRDIALESKLIK